jgi:hypothetical protein
VVLEKNSLPFPDQKGTWEKGITNWPKISSYFQGKLFPKNVKRMAQEERKGTAETAKFLPLQDRTRPDFLGVGTYGPEQRADETLHFSLSLPEELALVSETLFLQGRCS